MYLPWGVGVVEKGRSGRVNWGVAVTISYEPVGNWYSIVRFAARRHVSGIRDDISCIDAVSAAVKLVGPKLHVFPTAGAKPKTASVLSERTRISHHPSSNFCTSRTFQPSLDKQLL